VGDDGEHLRRRRQQNRPPRPQLGEQAVRIAADGAEQHFQLVGVGGAVVLVEKSGHGGVSNGP
jgi:hypothetical protein